MGLKILKWKCACGSSFVKIIWKPLSLKMSTTLRVRSSGNAFCRNYQRTPGMQKLRTCCSDSFHFEHCLLFSVCSISLVASVMLSMYAKLSSRVLT